MDPRSTNTAFAPDRCPLCGEPNGCAMAAGASGSESTCAQPCWCVNARFSPELLARVPAAAQRVACICARCAGAPAHA